MRTLPCTVLGILVITLIAALPAMAQTYGGAPNAPTPNFDQYPSFIETSSTLQDGTQVVLRCGYAATSAGIVPDASFVETSVLNERSGSYIRTQRIDHTIMLTTTGGAQGRYLIEATEPTGLLVAKGCQIDTATDSVQGCMPVQPTISAQQMITQDQNAGNQCSAFLTKATPQLDPATYNAQKTELFKNNLRQKARILETP